jgi:hypothetical protein
MSGSRPQNGEQVPLVAQPAWETMHDIHMGDQAMQEALVRLATTDPHRYNTIISDLRSGDQMLHQAGQEALATVMEKHDIPVLLGNRTYWLPMRNQLRFQAVAAIVSDESLDPLLSDNYKAQMYKSLSRVYNESERGTTVLSDRITNSLDVASAEMSVLLARLADYAFDGTPPLEDWADLYETYLPPLTQLLSHNYKQVNDVASGLLDVLGFKARNVPDLSSGDRSTFANLQHAFFFQLGNEYYPKNYEPDPISVCIALSQRIFDSRQEAPEVEIVVPSALHAIIVSEVQDAAGNFDPLKPLIEWLQDRQDSFDLIRMAMYPSPDNNLGLLNLSEDDFINRLQGSLTELPDFPNIRLILDPFYLNDIVIDQITFRPFPREEYAWKMPAGMPFYVKWFDGSGQYYRMPLYTPSGFICMLLQNIIENDRSSRDIERETEQFVQQEAEEFRSELKGLFGEGNMMKDMPLGADPYDYVPRILAGALQGKVAQMAAYSTTGISASDISVLASRARAQAAVRDAFSPADFVAVDEGAGSYWGPVMENGLGNAIRGLEGWEWMGPGLANAIDQWIYEQDMQIKDQMLNLGEADKLVEGSPASEYHHDLSRLPVVDMDAIIDDMELTFSNEKQDRPVVDFEPATRSVFDNEQLYNFPDGDLWIVPLGLEGPFYSDEVPISDKADLPKDGKIRRVVTYADGRKFIYFNVFPDGYYSK